MSQVAWGEEYHKHRGSASCVIAEVGTVAVLELDATGFILLNLDTRTRVKLRLSMIESNSGHTICSPCGVPCAELCFRP